MSKLSKITISILAVWLVVVALATTLTFVTATSKVTQSLDVMVEAASLTQQCQQAVRQLKVQQGIDTYPQIDKFDTGMLGIPSISEYMDYFDGSWDDYDNQFGSLLAITTTPGKLASKRTSCDPNWAGYMVSLYQRAGLKAGDQVGMTFSGSFPALNIAALASAQVYGLKICVMSGIGASYFGANDPRLTFFEMAQHLCDVGLLIHRIDYVSLGGEDDVLDNRFANTEEGKQHINRITQVIQASTAKFIYQPDFNANVEMRIDYFAQDLPQMKLFVNVGGSMVGLGSGTSAFTNSGYFKGGKIYSQSKRLYNQGLLQYYKQIGLPVVNIINVQQIAEQQRVPYADDKMTVAPQIGLTDYNVKQGYYAFYYVRSYSPIYAVVAISLSVVLAVLYAYCRKKYATNNQQGRNLLMGGH